MFINFTTEMFSEFRKSLCTRNAEIVAQKATNHTPVLEYEYDTSRPLFASPKQVCSRPDAHRQVELVLHVEEDLAASCAAAHD